MNTLAQPTTTRNPTPRRISLEVARMVASSLKVAEPGNASLWRALDKAVERMEQGQYMELTGNVLRIASETQADVIYATMLDECPCPCQEGVCYHRAACAILMTMETLEAAAQLCQPLVAKTPRRKRTAKPTTSRVELEAGLRAWREQRGITRATTQAELEAACNW